MHLHISTGRQGLTAQAHSQPIKRVCGSLFYIFIHYVYKWPEAESMFIDQTDTKSSSGRNAVTRYREAASLALSAELMKEFVSSFTWCQTGLC